MNAKSCANNPDFYLVIFILIVSVIVFPIVTDPMTEVLQPFFRMIRADFYLRKRKSLTVLSLYYRQ
jgi:hypothetical protein